jgi:hypothetical protein
MLGRIGTFKGQRRGKLGNRDLTCSQKQPMQLPDLNHTQVLLFLQPEAGDIISMLLQSIEGTYSSGANGGPEEI